MTATADFDFIQDAYQPIEPPTVNSEEQAIYGRCRQQLNTVRQANIIKQRYYEAKQNTRHMDISIPPQLRDVEVAVGWAGTIVDVLDERVDLQGFISKTGGDVLGLDEVFDDNYLEIESNRSHLDAFVTGTGFASLGTGDEENGEPPILITAESSLRATLLWDFRKRRAAAGLSQTWDERNRLIMETLYLPGSTVVYARDPQSLQMEVVSRDDHPQCPFVPMVRLPNRDRTSDPYGRSEITRGVRYYTDAAVRTALGMEVNREFYTAPQLFALHVRPEDMGVREGMTDEEKKALGWKIMMGHANLVPPPQPGDPPASLHQLTPSPPTPYVDQITAYSKMVAAESGLPVSYFGFTTDLAATGDAIRQEEYRLVRRAQRRIGNFRHSWRSLAWMTLLWRDGDVDMDAFRAIDTVWRNPATPTPSADADVTQKMIAAGSWAPHGQIAYDTMEITAQQRDQNDKDMAEHQQMLADQASAAAEQAAKVAAAAKPSDPAVQPNQNGTAPNSAKNPAKQNAGRTAAAAQTPAASGS